MYICIGMLKVKKITGHYISMILLVVIVGLDIRFIRFISLSGLEDKRSIIFALSHRRMDNRPFRVHFSLRFKARLSATSLL